MFAFEELRKLVDRNLSNLSLDASPKELYEPIKYVLDTGGKRLRPILVLTACNMFKEDISFAINAAMGTEVFHNFTLLHDDIMDHADVRRNKQTVHVKWDENRAILSGDAMLIKAYELISQSPSTNLPQVLKIFNQTALEVCEGQQFDMNFETQQNVSIQEYLEMIRLKTAVLIAGCLKIGAHLGEANKIDANRLYNFGINLGLAFQLQDDLLDTYGNYEKFGKKIGGDIIENKKTFLLIKAFELSNGQTQKELNDLIFGAQIQNEEKIIQVKKVYDLLEIKKITESQIEEYFNRALELLNQVNVDDSKKIMLRNFTNTLIKRDS